MSVTRFNLPRYEQPPQGKEIILPDWDEAYDEVELKKWGYVKNLTELKDLIEKTAVGFRQNIPEDDFSTQDFYWLKQDTPLVLHVRGGVGNHNDIYMWITDPLLKNTMRIIYSFIKMKSLLEKCIDKMDILFYKVKNALRYVYEEKHDPKEYNDMSGGDILITVGYVFAGDEFVSEHTKRTLIKDIISSLPWYVVESSQFNKGKGWRLLSDLLDDKERKGIKLNRSDHPTEVKTLKALLREKGYNDIANKIKHKEKTVSLDIPDGKIAII